MGWCKAPRHILALDGRGAPKGRSGCTPEVQKKESVLRHPFRPAAPDTFPIKGKD